MLTAVAAGAAAADPVLRVTTNIPDYAMPGNPALLEVGIENNGTTPVTADLTLKLTYPTGFTPADPLSKDQRVPDPECQQLGQVTECHIDAAGLPPGGHFLLRSFSAVDPGASGTHAGTIEVSGGGAVNGVSKTFSMTFGPTGPYGIESFDVQTPGPTAGITTRASSVPAELTTFMSFPAEARLNFNVPIPNVAVIAPIESFRNVLVHVPAGLVGNPTAPARCSAADLATVIAHSQSAVTPRCPDGSQIGLVQLNGWDITPLYNLVPPPGYPAAFGFNYDSTTTMLLAKVRPSDHGIDILAPTAVSSIPLPSIETTLWGVPADPSHDVLRGKCINGGLGNNGEFPDGCPTGTPRKAFLRLPTSCSGGPLDWQLELDTYTHPGVYHQKAATTPALSGCELVPFSPSFALAPSAKSTHTPSGIDATLALPQDNGPDGIATADLRKANVTLPQGLTINPSSADGLAACSDSDLRLNQDGPATCPDASKLGTVKVVTPLLDQEIGGTVFLRSQASQDPASGELYRLALELRSDERGVDIKLPGSLKVDSNTGRLTTSFANLPQLPFESMQLHLKSGPRAPLTTPSTCGTYTSHAELEGWNGKTVSLDPSFTVDQGCDHPSFAPGFEAAAQSPIAGHFSPFTLRVTRDAGQPNLSRIDATLPEGELAKLAGVPRCSGEQAAAGTCPAASQIGRVVAGVGEGTSPLFLPQAGKSPTAVYLTGPYKGAPYGVLARVPAQAGPFDLGAVLVRSALRVDPETARASVLSDPLLQIYAGIPVSYRDVRVIVDRPDFTINPTDCEPMATTAVLSSNAGDSAQVSDRFQVADCAALGFKPKLKLSLDGGTKRTGHPALTSVLTFPKKGSSANLASAQVTLPNTMQLDQSHIRTVCTRVQFAAQQCPAASIYGHARAITPLLDQPLEGPVYLRSSSHLLPDVVAALRGPASQPIEIDVAGRVDAVHKRLRTTFEGLPDTPVSRFVLSLQGRKKGLLVNNTDLCRHDNRATILLDGQNGKVADSTPKVSLQRCGGAPKRHGHRRG